MDMSWILPLLVAGGLALVPWLLIRWFVNSLGTMRNTGTTIDDYMLRGGKKDDSNKQV